MKVAAINDGLTPKYNVQCRLWASASNHTPFFPVAALVDIDGLSTIEVSDPANTASAVFLWEERAAGVTLKKAATATVGTRPMNRDVAITWANTDELIDVPSGFETCVAYFTKINGLERPTTPLGSKDYAAASEVADACHSSRKLTE